MEFLEVPLFDDDVFKMLIRFAFNLLILALIVRFAILPNQQDREFAFTVSMLNITVFFICFALKKLDLGIGMALGLFAIFGVLRYRTNALPIKEMTYLFIVIGIAVINSLSNKKTSYAELVAANGLILIAAFLKEKFVANGKSNTGLQEVVSKKTKKHVVEYDRLDLLAPEKADELQADLVQRTGMPITRIQVQNIDLKTNSVTLNIWCSGASAKDTS
ncbi:DUF4956 domain-containing protein [Rubripirellula sp.]|nr:DUF4956 domain-containing protein [Rubripirellula sp.]MDB4634394.1 DUF4956 domain-containing protein [Rubripirellula sp.]MDC0288804.1 DUF4956 domain-containing protein [Rubripirellula sp.]